MSKILKRAAAWSAAGVLLCLPVTAQAATVTFASPDWVYNNTDASEQANWLVEIDDLVANQWTFNISIAAPTTAVGDVLAFGFDSALTGLTFSSISNVSTSTGETLLDPIYGNGTNSQTSCGMGCNFNGVTDPGTNSALAFDYILKFGGQGSNNGLITSATFQIASAGLTLNSASFTQVGLRIQTLGTPPDGGGGSAKDYNSTPIFTPSGGTVPVDPVPLPAALWFIITALGSVGLLGWRKQKLATA